MEQFIIYLVLVLSGLCLGSFAGASVWRFRAYQLKRDKSEGEHVDADEYKSLEKLTKVSAMKDRSKCLHCSYTLKWYDMVPLVSWLSLGGKCRKCHKKIGFMEPMIELGVAVFFVLSYAFWPYSLDSSLEIIRLILWLLAGVGLAILFVYDAKWFLLPFQLNLVVIGIGALSALSIVLGSGYKSNAMLEIVGSVIILSGIYWVLYTISRHNWVGDGDAVLGLGLALLLADWKLAFVALFAANLIGCLIVLPGIISGKLKRDSHVPLGPLLIAGTVIAQLSGGYLMNIYFSSLF